MNARHLILPLLLVTHAAQAHITLEQREAEAGSAYKAVFKVGHGCAGSATRRITVTLPAGFKGARPVPKAGWTLSLRMGKLREPYESHGKPVTEGLTEVTWTASTEADWLQDAWYDEFLVRGTLPDQAGPLWFKVRQTCAQGESNWAETPAEGASTRGLKSPAALLLVTPRAPR